MVKRPPLLQERKKKRKRQQILISLVHVLVFGFEKNFISTDVAPAKKKNKIELSVFIKPSET